MNQSCSNKMNIDVTNFSKVPEITLLFWITKVLTTGMGEVASDYLAHTFNPVIAVACAGTVLVAFLALQFSVNRYKAWIYWFNVIMVSIFGTMAADILHIGLGIPYVVSTSFFLAALAFIFVAWYKKEGTLSIHSITTRQRELFYWAAILTTFALGTATGDMTASTMHLGYFYSGVIFAIIIAIPAIAYLQFHMNEIWTFWFAYIVTRPLGASFADWIGVSKSRGGLGIGTGIVSLVLTAIILTLVGYMAFRYKYISDRG